MEIRTQQEKEHQRQKQHEKEESKQIPEHQRRVKQQELKYYNYKPVRKLSTTRERRTHTNSLKKGQEFDIIKNYIKVQDFQKVKSNPLNVKKTIATYKC